MMLPQEKYRYRRDRYRKMRRYGWHLVHYDKERDFYRRTNISKKRYERNSNRKLRRHFKKNYDAISSRSYHKKNYDLWWILF